MGRHRKPHPRVNPEALVSGETSGVTGGSLTAIPQQVMVKPAFEERYKLLLGDRYDEFLKYSLSYSTKSIRVNTLKVSVDELKRLLEKNWVLTPVPWCQEGFFCQFRTTGDEEERYDIGNLPEHQLGYIYVQDAASMIPPVALDVQPGMRVLDLCAAPGSKTTQIAQYLGNTGVLVGNDFSGDRLNPLGLNIQRCGVMDCIITLRGNNRFANESFDRVLVDAPCSGTGTVRRSLKTLQMWSPALVRKLVGEQRRLIETGWRTLAPGGILVYSTCTQEPEEDEGLVSWFLEKHPEAELLPIDIDIKRSAAVTSWDGVTYDASVEKCLRIYPQDNDTEGFFVAKLQKKLQQP
jgi:NOL1/NOP2/sun family putative RNA methylase